MKIKLQFIGAVALMTGFIYTGNAQVISSSASPAGGINSDKVTPDASNGSESDATVNLLAPGHGKKGKQPLGNAFSGDIISANIGLLSGIGDIYTTSSLSYMNPTGLSNAPSPGFGIGYEHALSHAIGVGLNVGYQGATTKFSTVGWSYSQATGFISPFTNSYQYSLSMPTFLLRGAFHFTAGTKIDPYAGINLGYCILSTSQSFGTNDPNINTPSDNNASYPAPVSLSGIAYGLFVGGRYFITDKFGAWLEIRYSNVTLSSFHLNVNVNPATLITIGVCVKL